MSTVERTPTKKLPDAGSEQSTGDDNEIARRNGDPSADVNEAENPGAEKSESDPE